ncbi:MAG: YdeI/OmpD-associated family protein [Alphaproteobacteria bacterium]|nr:YdeI/OmpD-associated family protein [Alphaproteobacteria bacterium]
MSEPLRFDAFLERHDPDLPVYVIVPARVARAYSKQRTFVVEAAVNGRNVGRRSIKPWGDGRWFMELTKVHCRRLDIAPGDRLSVSVSLAQELPTDLQARISELDLSERWEALSEAQRRAFAETVFEAKKPETRQARIERVLAALRAGQG